MNTLFRKLTRLLSSQEESKRRSYARKAVSQFTLESLETRTLLAANLVKDINTILNSAGSDPRSFTDVGGITYFSAIGIGYGRELWKSDGTAAGTVMVSDIVRGSGSSNPVRLTNVNGMLYFNNSNGVNGTELWKSDGTPSGTVMVSDISNGIANSNPSNLTNVNGTLYFTASNGFNGYELWKSDGTNAGTVMVRDILSGLGASNPSYLTNVNGTLYFRATNGVNGIELWKSDGTVAGTVMVSDIQGGSGSSGPQYLTNLNGALYFRANNGVNGSELWKSNGTAVGTVLVSDIFSGGGSSSPQYLTNVNGTLYFTASNSSNGTELWKSDGTSVGTVLVSDILNGNVGSSPQYLTNVNGTLYFRASNSVNGQELWKSNGSAAGTIMVSDIFSGSNGSSARYLTNVNGTLYFRARNAANGYELWKSDGTVPGTVIVSDIVDGTGSSAPGGLTNVNGTLYFSATNGVSGVELWKSNGTTTGTLMVADIVAGSGNSSPSSLTNVNGTLYFAASDGVNGTELWKSDGTAAGTVMVSDILPGSGSSVPQYLTNVNGTLYFRASNGVNGGELWKSDGTAAGTVMIRDIQSGGGTSFPSDLTNVNGTLYFRSNDGASGAELWKSDGSAAGTSLMLDINSGSGSSNPSSLVNLNGMLYFRATNGLNGEELWRCDGTVGGTVMVSDINPGVDNSTPRYLTNVNGTLYFNANNGTNGYELWKMNPASSSLFMVSDIFGGSRNSFPARLSNVNGLLYFFAANGVNGIELWKSDGTAAGTVQVVDLNAGAGSGIGSGAIASFDGWVLFSGTRGDDGAELWITDGTAKGTKLLAEIASGVVSSEVNSLLNIGSQTFFSAFSPEVGVELWNLTLNSHGASLSDGLLTLDLSQSAGNTNIGIRTSGGFLQIVDLANNTVLLGNVAELPIGDVRGISVIGSDGFSDSLTVDLSSGTTGFPLNISFDGGSGGNDTLSVIGATGIDAVYSQSASTSSVSLSNNMLINYRDAESTSVTAVRGVSVSGNIDINSPVSFSHQLPLNLGLLTSISGSTLASNTTVSLASGESIWGSGIVFGRISAEAGSLIHADGPMALGNSSSVLGFLTRGDIETGANTVTLLDANQAVLGSGTILGTSTSTGTVVAANGALIDFGNNLIGYGTLQTPNLSSTPTLINGAVQGNSLAQPVTLTGYIKGVGTLDNVSIAGTYSPGFSPAAVTLGNMVYAGTSTTVIELAGTIPGTEYDQLNHIGQALLGGTLHVDLLNGYQPTLGTSYTILTATVGLSGSFASVELPTLSGNLSWQLIYGTNQLVLNVVQNNVPPTDISLSGTTIPENSGVNALIGTLSGSDTNIGDSLTFSLPANTGHNNLFNISGTSLRANDSFDFEGVNSFSITVRATDAGGLTFDKTFTITVANVNESPTDVSLPNTLVTENLPTGTNVGSFQTVDPDSGNTFTYALVTGTGADHNASFSIAGATLKTSAAFNFEAQSSYSIRVRSTDQNGLYVEKVFTIQITNVTELGGIDTQLGQTQRSYVRYLDVLFDRPDDIMSMVNNGRFQLTKRDLNGLNPTGVSLSPGMFSAVGNSARLDFGVNGLGGNRNTTAGDGYYELGVDMDGNGSFESKKYFYRLLGDVNGDRKVDSTDSSLVTSAFGTTNPNRDVNGDGTVNANDRTLLLRSLGRKLKDDLFADD